MTHDTFTHVRFSVRIFDKPIFKNLRIARVSASAYVIPPEGYGRSNIGDEEELGGHL